jgi:hypothetical protein
MLLQRALPTADSAAELGLAPPPPPHTDMRASNKKGRNERLNKGVQAFLYSMVNGEGGGFQGGWVRGGEGG